MRIGYFCRIDESETLMDVTEIGALIASKLHERQERLRRDWLQCGHNVRYFFVDDVLPQDLAQELAKRFPAPEQMMLKHSLRERKYVSAQMDCHDPLLEAALFAFQTPRVVAAISAIAGKADLEPDPELYAGGLSLMAKGHFLNPHLDNSHNMARRRWRNLNLLYYVSPDWSDERGGHLELWPVGPRGHPITLPSRFNRLVVMEAHHRSWHSVSPILDGQRRCISNYYFAETPMRADQPFHVTSFRGRPEQPLRDALLRVDIALRMGVRKLFPQGLGKVRLRYQH
jgi:Rps23 Pro-64 3,4-dihydroxylase Tpa1-like proline 4-hydroxylase